jgi:hypothetical protein
MLAAGLLGEGDTFRIEYVRISGNQIVPSDSILSLALVPVGSSIFDLPLTVVERRIRRHSWIADVHAKRHLPNVIEIKVTEREPIAALRDNQLFVVTADSIALIPPAEKWIWDLPILSSPTMVHLRDGEPVKDRATLTLLHEALIAFRVDKSLRDNLSEIYYKNGDMQAVLTKPPLVLNLGTGVNELAWIGLRAYISAKPTSNSSSNAEFIDLHIAGKLIVKPINPLNEEPNKGEKNRPST